MLKALIIILIACTIAGSVQAQNAVEFYKGKTLRFVTGGSSGSGIADRHPAVAEIPTLKELGYDIIAPSWVALSAPAALDASIVLRLNEATNRILSREEIKSRLFEDAIQTQPLNPAQTRAFVEAETAAWKDRLRVIQMLK